MAKLKNDLFSKSVDLVKDELNKRKWLPFITRSMILRLFTTLANRWQDTYRKQRHEDSEKVLHRMEELDKLYGEREQHREEELRKRLDIQEKAMLQASSKAFCQGVCKERSQFDNNAMCSCQRRNRYLKALEEQFNAYMADNAEKLITDYKEAPRWKEQDRK